MMRLVAVMAVTLGFLATAAQAHDPYPAQAPGQAAYQAAGPPASGWVSAHPVQGHHHGDFAVHAHMYSAPRYDDALVVARPGEGEILRMNQQIGDWYFVTNQQGLSGFIPVGSLMLRPYQPAHDYQDYGRWMSSRQEASGYYSAFGWVYPNSYFPR